MPARPYKTSDYLLTAADKAAYLNEALATEDPQLWMLALNNLREAESSKPAWSDPVSSVLKPTHQALLTELNHYLGHFQLRLSVSVTEPTAS